MTTREARAKKLVRALSIFVKENSAHLTTHAHGMITTSDSLKKSLEDANKDALGRLEGAFYELLSRFTTVLTHRGMLHRERYRCLKLMEVTVRVISRQLFLLVWPTSWTQPLAV